MFTLPLADPEGVSQGLSGSRPCAIPPLQERWKGRFWPDGCIQILRARGIVDQYRYHAISHLSSRSIIFTTKHSHLINVDRVGRSQSSRHPIRSHSSRVPERSPLSNNHRSSLTWPMEDHLCPRLVQPQAACLSCLASPRPLSKLRTTRCYDRISTIDRALKLSPPSQAQRPLIHPALRPRPPPPSTQTHNTIQHLSPPRCSSPISSSNTTTSTRPALPPTSPLYTRLMNRYTNKNIPWSRPINSR
jgi:hypothetical protein